MSCSCDAAHALHLTAAMTHCGLGICAESAGPQKRPVAGPRKGFTLSNAKLETITPIPYDILKVSRYLGRHAPFFCRMALSVASLAVPRLLMEACLNTIHKS